MKIDKENYEAWMLDYLEGKLSGKQLALFEQFLSEHPELREEAEGVEKIHLEPSERFFGDKSILKAKMLKQVIDEEELTTFEAAEGTLETEKRERLNKRMAGSGRLASKLQHYKDSRLVADDSIVYPYKDALRRSEAIVAAPRERALWPYLIAAAVMTGVVYFAIPSDDQAGPERQPMAKLVAGGEKKNEKATKKVEVKTVTPAVQPASQLPEPVKQEASPNMTKAMKVMNKGAVIKHETLTAPMPDLASNSKRKSSRTEAIQAVKEEAPIIREPMYYQKELQSQLAEVGEPRVIKPAQRPNSYTKPASRNGVKGSSNSNFVRTPDSQQFAGDVAESRRRISPGGSKFIARITGDRLKVESTPNNKVSVKFESQLLGFSTTF